MSLARVWLVKDPRKSSTLNDIFWEQDVASLNRYILGDPHAWTEENHAICVTREEAETEARARFKQIAERFAEIAATPSPRKGQIK